MNLFIFISLLKRAMQEYDFEKAEMSSIVCYTYNFKVLNKHNAANDNYIE